MANHVYFNCSLDVNNEQSALVEKLMNKCKTENGEMKWISYELQELPIYPVKYDEDDWYMWGCNNMGAKWVSCDDYDADGCFFSGHSAWSPIIPLVENLCQYIVDIEGSEVSAKLTYEDEFRNFIGVAEFYTENGEIIVDIDEEEGDDLTNMVREAFGFDDEQEFEWWEVYPIKYKHSTYRGEDWEPQQYVDEVVYQYFEIGRLQHL
jgi:hypothetical protein